LAPWALGVLLGTSWSASAQQPGVILGVNFATIDVVGEEEVNLDKRTGFAVGILVNMPVGSAVSIQPEVLYSQKGVKFAEAGGEATFEVDYLDIPVLVRATAGGRTGLVVFGGPSFGFKVRARAKGEFEGETEEQDLSDQIEPFDWGLVAGAGIQTEQFMLDGRYQWGMSNVNRPEFDAVEAKNRVFSIVVGILF
jgi:hypothetical protein